MTVFDTFGIVSGISNGHVPASYLGAGGRHVYRHQLRQTGTTVPGSGLCVHLHAEIDRTPPGFMVGWSSLLDYLFLPMINVLLAKIYLSALFPEVPPWVWVVGFVTILTLANLKSVNLVANFNTLFVLVQIAIMVVFVILVVHGLHKGGRGHRLVAAAVYQRERTSDPDYYRRDYRLLLSSGLTRSPRCRKRRQTRRGLFPKPFS